MSNAPAPSTTHAKSRPRPTGDRISYAAEQIPALIASLRTALKTLRDAGEGNDDALYFANEAGGAVNALQSSSKALVAAIQKGRGDAV